MSQSSFYTVFCIVLDEDAPFSIEIKKSDLVDDLKKAIKKEKPNRFAVVDANELTLYHVDIADDDDLEKNINKKINANPPLKLLRPTHPIKGIYPDSPPEQTVHILVKVPKTTLLGSKRKDREPGTSSSDSEAPPDNKKQKVQHKPRLSDLADGLFSRSKTVEALYKKLKEHKFIFVRGTPASGKTSLAMLLRKYIIENHPKKEVRFLPRYRDEPVQKPIMDWQQWLSGEGWNFPSDGILILDEAQLSYWDTSFWLSFIKAINPNTTHMVILFASYGSAGRQLLNKSTPLVVREEQLIGLARGPTEVSVGLLLTREEMEGVVRKSFLNHHFDVSLLDYVHSLTSGHVGACCDALMVVQKTKSYRETNRAYTYYDFALNFDMSDFLKELSDHGVFSRGLPMRDDLEDPKKPFVKNLRDVLNTPSRSALLDKDDDQRDSGNPLRLCLEQGWLFSEPAGEAKVEYRFASQLHQLYTEWLLLRSEDLIKDLDLQTFVIKVIGHFSPQNLQTREDLSTTPQPIPEAQFQQEFYRACCVYTGGCVTTFPECGTPKGRIDFFIRSKKWGVELMRDGDRLLDHNARFTTGEYRRWLDNGNMKDYILIDFRSKKPTKTRSDIKPLISVVATNNWHTLEIYNHKLENIKSFNLFYHEP